MITRAVFFLGVWCSVSAAQNWPQGAGPHGNWTTKAENPPTSFSVTTGENVLWRTPLPESGQGSVVAWGDSNDGGDSSSVSSQLQSGVVSIFSTDRAFAAIKSDGSVVTWGYSSYGGDSSSVASSVIG